MPQFYILFYANYTILATHGGAWPNGTPLNAPLARTVRKSNSNTCSVIRCQKNTSRLRLTGSTAQPMSCMVCWLISKVESRTQGSRPRTQKNFEAEAKAKDRNARGQGQGPKTQTHVFSKKKGLQNFFSGEKNLQNFFSGDLYLRKLKKRSLQIFRKISEVFQRNFNGSKIVLSSSRGQGSF